MTKPTNKKELSKKPIKTEKGYILTGCILFCSYDVFYFIN